MDKKLEFNEALSALIEYATVNGNEITLENVHTYFDDILEKFTAKLLSNYQWETYYQLFSDRPEYP